MEKRIHELMQGDIVKFSGCLWEITRNARPSRAHDVDLGVPATAVAEAVCVKGMDNHFPAGANWTFQGNFKAPKYSTL